MCHSCSLPLKKKKKRRKQMPPEHRIKQHQNHCFHRLSAICSNFANKNPNNAVARRIGRCRFAAVTSPSNNLNHHLNYSHNNDTRALHYEHYCWEMGPAEVKDESYLSLSVGTLVMVTGPSDLCWGFSLSSARQIYHQITGWCQCPLHEMGWPSIAVWLRSLEFTSNPALLWGDGVKQNNKKKKTTQNQNSTSR